MITNSFGLVEAQIMITNYALVSCLLGHCGASQGITLVLLQTVLGH